MQQILRGKRFVECMQSWPKAEQDEAVALSSRFLPSLCPITDSYPPFPESSLTSSPSETAQLAKLTSAERSLQCPALPPAAPL